MVILACLGLCGCASTGNPLKADYKQSIKQIAVVSAMGDDFIGRKVGTTIFNNQNFKDNFSSFNMDDKIEDAVAGYLRENSGFIVTARPDLRTDLRNIFSDKRNAVKSKDNMRPYLKDLKSKGVDALLVVWPDLMQYETSSTWLTGYGLAVRTFLMLSDAEAYFISQISLFDTASEEVIFDRNFWKTKGIKFSKWSLSFGQLSPQEQKDIKAFFQEVTESKIPELLKKFNF